nr:phosphatidylglycerol lysyltransferase domain-containing protein [Lysinibacillus timonensis]
MIFKKNLIAYSQKKRTNRGLSENHLFEYDQIQSFLKEKGGNHVSHLIFLKDKKPFWTKDQSVLIVYKRIFNKLVVLGDPIGEESNIPLAISEFNEFCKQKKVKPIFYQVSPRYMQFYHDVGFRFVKQGEEAVIQLENFSLVGKRRGNLRTSMNKLSRNGFTFCVIEPPHCQKILEELKTLSDSWLGNDKEKGFSVVSFREDYVSSFPIALLHDPDGKIVAFATLATDYKETLNIDLMRKSKQSPNGAMDVLFVNVFEWARNNGFHKCSLGMAPLSNVGNSKHAFYREKMIHLIYLYGNNKYNFKGLKEFKSKFATDWEPKYLAYKKSFLPILLLQLVLLINQEQKPLEETKMRKNLLSVKNIFSKLDF